MKGVEGRKTESHYNFGLEQYEKGTLIDLMKAYSKLYISVDGFWYLAVKNESGEEKALEYDIWVWEKMYKREVDSITKALRIKERDVPSFLNVFLMTPWFQSMRYEIRIEDTNHGILTINHCPTLLALENEGEGREDKICNLVDKIFFSKACKHFNPNLECNPIKLPPREKQEGICCEWEFTLL